jgi:hypothetical protein
VLFISAHSINEWIWVKINIYWSQAISWFIFINYLTERVLPGTNGFSDTQIPVWAGCFGQPIIGLYGYFLGKGPLAKTKYQQY